MTFRNTAKINETEIKIESLKIDATFARITTKRSIMRHIIICVLLTKLSITYL